MRDPYRLVKGSPIKEVKVNTQIGSEVRMKWRERKEDETFAGKQKGSNESCQADCAADVLVDAEVEQMEKDKVTCSDSCLIVTPSWRRVHHR